MLNQVEMHLTSPYLRGNSYEMLYSCETGTRKVIGDVSQPRMLCDGVKCLVSESAEVLRYLDLTVLSESPAGDDAGASRPGG